MSAAYVGNKRQCRIDCFDVAVTHEPIRPEPNDDDDDDDEYASTGIAFRAGEVEAGDRLVGDGLVGDGLVGDGLVGDGLVGDVVLDMLLSGAIEPERDPNESTAEQRLGLALLRLRVYRGWSQAKLERVSGVDQTIISRLETGKSRGTTIRCLFAILSALRADEITFGPGARLPQSSWEDAMYGDLWDRASLVAKARLARLNRRRSA